MPGFFEGSDDASGFRFGIVASRFNERHTEALLEGAVRCLEAHGASSDRIRILRVPGAFEIPQVTAWLAKSGTVDAIVTLGALIRGDTPHFDYISAQTTDGVSRVAEGAGIPVCFGVITCDTIEQADERCFGAHNKGWEAALAAIEMAGLRTRLTEGGT